MTEDVIRELTDYCRSNYGLELPPGADPVKEIMDSAKTEIHLSLIHIFLHGDLCGRRGGPVYFRDW